MLLTLSLRCRRCFCGGTVSALCPSPVSRCCLAPFHHPPFSHTRPHNPCPAPLCRTTSSCWCPRCESTHISTRVPACMHKLPPPRNACTCTRAPHTCMHACMHAHTHTTFFHSRETAPLPRVSRPSAVPLLSLPLHPPPSSPLLPTAPSFPHCWFSFILLSFLQHLARRLGRMSKGGVPDINAAARVVLQVTPCSLQCRNVTVTVN